MLLGPLFWYCEIQGFHTFLGLRRLDPHQGSALDLSGACNVPRPPAMLSNDRISKTRLSIPHLLGGVKILSAFCRGEENFLTLPLQENYIPPHIEKMIRPLILKSCTQEQYDISSSWLRIQNSILAVLIYEMS